MSNNILLVSSSAQGTAASSFQVAQQIVEKLDGAELKVRDLSSGLPSINQEWVSANFTEQSARSDDQHKALSLSDELIMRSASRTSDGLFPCFLRRRSTQIVWVNVLALEIAVTTVQKVGHSSTLDCQ